jgi:uncharacterized protein YcgL (UPF0745 family)
MQANPEVRHTALSFAHSPHLMIPTPMRCYVYRSEKRADTYVYLRDEGAFELLPDPLRASLSPLVAALSFELTEGRALAREDAAVVRANLRERGFHVQLPPPAHSLPDMMPAHGG